MMNTIAASAPSIPRVEYTAPRPYTSEARRITDWTILSNENLKFAYDLLALHHSIFEADAANEIERRIQSRTWLDLEKSPPPLHELPVLFLNWPFSLLWNQCPKR
jgi:hypothetical protein